MTTSSKQKEQSFSPKETKRISILNSNSNSLEFQTREEETLGRRTGTRERRAIRNLKMHSTNWQYTSIPRALDLGTSREPACPRFSVCRKLRNSHLGSESLAQKKFV
jgi:hypothetical protein